MLKKLNQSKIKTLFKASIFIVYTLLNYCLATTVPEATTTPLESYTLYSTLAPLFNFALSLPTVKLLAVFAKPPVDSCPLIDVSITGFHSASDVESVTRVFAVNLSSFFSASQLKVTTPLLVVALTVIAPASIAFSSHYRIMLELLFLW